MKELLYFSSSDLMIQVSYKEDVNALHYLSHRELSFGERVVVEQYLLTNIAVKTEYYRRHPAMLNYIGVDSKLVKELNQFHLKNTISDLRDKEDQVAESVQDLIDSSLANYYFEQIGNTLLEFRQASKSTDAEARLRCVADRLKELVQAYNCHSEKRVEIEDIVPGDLKTYFE